MQSTPSGAVPCFVPSPPASSPSRLGQAQAITAVTLCAEPFQKTLSSTSVPMWGYRQVATVAACDTPGTPTAPGPVLSVPQGGDFSLAVTVVNKLTVPTSLVIAGQSLPLGGAPVMAADIVGPACVPTPGATGDNDPQNCRVRSFTSETPPGESRTYVFNNLRRGTYLYESGTHQQVQVQMGMAGMLVVGNDNPGAVVEDAHVVLSEVDPAMHATIASTLGSANPASWKAGQNSTLGYAPTLFLINGEVFDSSTSLTDIGVTANDGALVRLRVANAGLASRVLTLNSGTWQLAGEDGYAYPAKREQATALMPASKTMDLDMVLDSTRHQAFFDRRDGSEVAGGSALAGQVARIVAAGAPTGATMDPIADQVANEGVAYSLRVLGRGLGNYTDWAVSAAPAPATALTVDAATHTIAWGAPAGATFVVTVNATNPNNGNVLTQTFSLRVNHAPSTPTGGTFAASDTGSAMTATGNALAGASDPDADGITALRTSAALSGLSLQSNGDFTWSGVPTTTAQDLTFSVKARDPYNLTSSDPAAVIHVTVAANHAPVVSSKYSVGGPRNINLRNNFSAGDGNCSAVLLSCQLQAISQLILPAYGASTSVSTGPFAPVPTDPDGAATVALNSFSAVVTRVNNSGTAIGMTSRTGIEGSAAVSADGTTITFLPRRRGNGNLYYQTSNNGNYSSSTCSAQNNNSCMNSDGSLGKYRIDYSVKDKWGLASNTATVYVNVQP